MDYHTVNYTTGQAPPQATLHRSITEKEKVVIWFVEPLRRMREDDAFVCLMTCFPLLEAVMRLELNISETQDVTFSDDSPALQWFAKFMAIPTSASRELWDASRNGLLHRAMIKGSLNYELTGEESDRPAKVVEGRVTIYVWCLRDRIVDKLLKHHKRLWQGSGNDLPAIYVKA